MWILLAIAPLLYADMRHFTDAKQLEVYILETKETEKEEVRNDSVACSCVQYVLHRGGDIPKRNASEIWPATTTPRVGGVAVFRYPNAAHVAYVEAVDGDEVTIAESNYRPCEVGRRTISVHDRRLIGFR